MQSVGYKNPDPLTHLINASLRNFHMHRHGIMMSTLRAVHPKRCFSSIFICLGDFQINSCLGKYKEHLIKIIELLSIKFKLLLY